MAADEPASWDAAAAVAACPVAPWSGDVWRCHSRRSRAESAAGSLKVTGRFHRGLDRFPESETWSALYTSLALHVALGERLRHTTPEVLHTLAHQCVSRLRAELRAVVVVCAPCGCAELALPDRSLDDLCQPQDYRSTHALARAARDAGEARLADRTRRKPRPGPVR